MPAVGSMHVSSNVEGTSVSGQVLSMSIKLGELCCLQMFGQKTKHKRSKLEEILSWKQFSCFIRICQMHT